MATWYKINKPLSLYSPKINNVTLVLDTVDNIIDTFSLEIFNTIDKPSTDYLHLITTPWTENYYPWLEISFPWLVESKQSPTYTNIQKP